MSSSRVTSTESHRTRSERTYTTNRRLEFTNPIVENVTTTFTPKDWDRKFEVGSDNFTLERNQQITLVPAAGVDASPVPITIDIPESDGHKSDIPFLVRLARDTKRVGTAERKHDPDYAEQKARGFARRGSAQSGSRFREGSLFNRRPVGPKATQAHDAEETLAKSLGDTKFTPEKLPRTFTLRPPCLQEQILSIQMTAT